MKTIKRIILILLTAGLLIPTASVSEEPTAIEMYVLASQLNGRDRPSKKAHIEARFDYGETVQCTGKWSDDMQWLEVKGGESGTCWCKAKYLTERFNSFKVENEHKTRIKIRNWPEGKVRSYLGAGKTIEITQVLLGWGKCSRGWIDLGYLVEVEE